MHAHAVDDAAWESPWRRRSVRDKACLSVGLVLTALLAPPFPGTVLVAIAVILLTRAAGVPLRLLCRMMRGPLVFLGIGAVTVALSLGGQDVMPWTWGPFGASPQTLARAGGVFGHGIAGTLALLLLATTTPMVDLVAAGRRARIPDPLLDIASLTYRLLFVLAESMAAIREAQVSRLGYDSWRASWRSSGMLAAAVLTRAWDRARRLNDGLAGRGYEVAMLTLAPPTRRSTPFLLGGIALVAVIAGASFGWAELAEVHGWNLLGATR